MESWGVIYIGLRGEDKIGKEFGKKREQTEVV